MGKEEATCGCQDVEEDLAARVRRLESRALIDDLIVRYAVACDDRDIEAIGECFTPDGSFVSVGGVISGRQALKEYYTERFRLYGPTFHNPGRGFIDFQDDENATGTVLAHSELMLDDGPFIVAQRYVDTYQFHEGRWRFKSRVNQFLYGTFLRDLMDLDHRQPRRRWPGVAPQQADIPEQLETWKDFYNL